jgi:multiple sugar transport system substrate-binding protein
MKKVLSMVLALGMLLSIGMMSGLAEAASSGEATEILVWTFLNPNDESGRGKVLGDCKKLYEETYPNVKVTIESQQWDTMTAKFFAAAQTGDAPDVIWVNGLDLGEAIRLGVVEPFENLFLKDWTPEQIADLDDARFRYGASDGKHYQLHLSTNVYGILYRADIFEKFGIDPNFQSWDKLIEAAQKMTYVDENGMQVYGLGSAYSMDNAESDFLRASLFTQYGDIVDENGKANWASEVGAKALQMEIDMIDKYQITPSSAISQSQEELFADMDGKPGRGLAAGWNVCVWSGSQRKEEAGRFIEILCSPAMDAKWVVEAGQIPLLKSTVEATKDFITQPDNKFLAVASDLLSNNAVTYNSQYVISGYTKDLKRSMQLAYVEGYSVEEALKTTAAEFDERTGN